MFKYAVNESDLSTNVCVLLEGRLEGSITVTLSTTDQSATGMFQMNSSVQHTHTHTHTHM